MCNGIWRHDVFDRTGEEWRKNPRNGCSRARGRTGHSSFQRRTPDVVEPSQALRCRTEERDRSHLAERPALAAWSRFEPASYQAWLTAFEVGAVTKKQIPLDTRDGLISAGKHNSSFDSAVRQGLALASDESLIAYADALVSAAEELERRDKQACVDYLYPPVLGVDLSEMISTATLNEDTAATAAVLTSGAAHAGSQLPEYRALPLLAPVLRDLSKEFGQEWHVISHPYGRDIDASLLCGVRISLIGESCRCLRVRLETYCDFTCGPMPSRTGVCNRLCQRATRTIAAFVDCSRP